jgi:hypothetical protein
VPSEQVDKEKETQEAERAVAQAIVQSAAAD